MKILEASVRSETNRSNMNRHRVTAMIIFDSESEADNKPDVAAITTMLLNATKEVRQFDPSVKEVVAVARDDSGQGQAIAAAFNKGDN